MTTLRRRIVKWYCCRRKGAKASHAQISIHGVTGVGTPSTSIAPQYKKYIIFENEKGCQVRDMSSIIININLVMNIMIFMQSRLFSIITILTNILIVRWWIG